MKETLMTNLLTALAAPSPPCPSKIPKSPNCNAIRHQKKKTMKTLQELSHYPPVQPPAEDTGKSLCPPSEVSFRFYGLPLDQMPYQLQQELVDFAVKSEPLEVTAKCKC